MNPLKLLQLAMDNAIKESVNRYPGEKTFLYFNGESEYTITNEAGTETLLKVEPNSILIATYINGKKQ